MKFLRSASTCSVLLSLSLAVTAAGCGDSSSNDGPPLANAGDAPPPGDGSANPPAGSNGDTPPPTTEEPPPATEEPPPTTEEPPPTTEEPPPATEEPPPTTEEPPPGTEEPPPAAAPLVLSQPLMGTNLNSVSYYSPEWAFLDLMKGSHMEKSGFPWMLDGGSAPAVDADGYPIGLGFGQSVMTLLYRSTSGRYPGGTYTVLFEGKGEVQLSGDVSTTRYVHDGQGTARFQVEVSPRDGVILKILGSSASNHVRNIRVVPAEHEATYASQPFHPEFLERLAPYGVLRFMDWGETDHSELVRWSDRKRPTYRTQYREGVAYEYMIQLCNAQQKHPWICIPHKADDDYVENLAKLFRDHLDPSLELFVEYSNEVWNSGFDQADDVRSWASANGVSWHTEYARRAVRHFKTFERVFGGTDRLVRVLGAQAASSYVAKEIIEATPEGAADALAIAPYFGGRLGSSLASDARGWTISEILDYCEDDLARWVGKTAENKALADAAGLALIAYEGGQHLAAVGSNDSDSTLVNKLVEANRHSRMGTIYREYFADWAAGGGGVFCHFSSCYTPSKHGSWGALEYQTQDDAPKFEALVDVSKEWATSD